MRLSEHVKSKAAALGFARCGITRVAPLDPASREKFLKWLEADFHGEMGYMEHALEKRINPGQVLDGARSLMTVLINYFTPHKHSSHPVTGVVSRYAWGRDYHLTVRNKLAELNSYLSSLVTSHSSLFYVDTGPVLEKGWAERAGLGWVGKNANLITPQIGSWVFIGEILTTIKFEEEEYDPPFVHPRQRTASIARLHSSRENETLCGTCTRCIEVCPTRAIVSPFVVDSRRCISYLTIELRGAIPRRLRPLIGNRIFGCDDCQDVCPWNRFATPTSEPDFHPDVGNLFPRLVEWMRMTRDEFKHRFKHSPIKRAKYAGFLRNVAVALGNSHSEEAVPALTQALSHPEPLVRQHAAWALNEIGTDDARQALAGHRSKENDPTVLAEMDQR